jgi:2-isopropylmalate synthase
VIDYHEHAVGRGADAEAAAYVEMADASGRRACGVGRDPDIVTAAMRAITGAVNRLIA